MHKATLAAAIAVALNSTASADLDPMAEGLNGYEVSDPLFTVGEDINGYEPPGILDGLGAVKLNRNTVRVFANHELLNGRGYEYTITQGTADTTDDFTLRGARVSFFDIDRKSREIVDAGLAYERIYDANGDLATDASFLAEPFLTRFGQGPGDGQEFEGFSRFCSSVLVEAGEFNRIPGRDRRFRLDRGPENDLYFTGEEDGGGFNSVGGAEWVLDVHTGDFWQVPAMGRGAWENVSAIDTGSKRYVAYILMDDSSPFDVDDYAAEGAGLDDNGNSLEPDVEAAPLYLYVGEKKPRARLENGERDFLARNGLRDGKLFVWVSDTGETRPSQFNGTSPSLTLDGTWVEIDNSPNPGDASQDGSTGYDEYGYPTQRTLWSRAEEAGAFGLSRPEDAAYNPQNPSEAVIASTGVDTYDVDPDTETGSDTFGTIYLVDTDFSDIHNPTATLTIIYDGDTDPTRALRSPDNLDWADDGFIYVQEDEAEEDTLSGDEALFLNDPAVDPDQPPVANPNEAGIVRLNPDTGELLRVANIDRSVVLDASIAEPEDAIDRDAGFGGEWESSGILDVSRLFGEQGGTLFLFDVQAHGIEDQRSKEPSNPNSRIEDDDLVEGGQLLFLERDEDDDDDDDERDDDDDDDDDEGDDD